MSECIETTRARNQDGYGAVGGVLRFGKKIQGAHVLAWIDANGRLPGPGMVIRHSCDNPPCVNPEHLVEGTLQENIDDREARGRSFKRKGKPTCKYGHSMHDAYVYEKTKPKTGKKYIYAMCRTCVLMRSRGEQPVPV